MPPFYLIIKDTLIELKHAYFTRTRILKRAALATAAVMNFNHTWFRKKERQISLDHFLISLNNDYAMNHLKEGIWINDFWHTLNCSCNKPHSRFFSVKHLLKSSHIHSFVVNLCVCVESSISRSKNCEMDIRPGLLQNIFHTFITNSMCGLRVLQ